MELRQLRYFVIVAEELHFGRAAERLRIVQSAVSQQARRLERELGVELLDRSPRHVRLTVAGQRFLPEARAVLAAAEHARESVSALGGVRPTVRIGVSEGLGDRLDRVLATFVEHGPGVAVDLVSMPTRTRLDRVRDGDLAATFVRGVPEFPGVRLIPVWDDAILVGLPADHPLAGSADDPGAPLELAGLAALPLRLVARDRNPPLFDRVLTACHDSGFTPALTTSAGSLQNTLTMIGVGDPSWTVVYESQSRVLTVPRVRFRRSRPSLAMTTYLGVSEGREPAWLPGLLRGCRDLDS